MTGANGATNRRRRLTRELLWPTTVFALASLAIVSFGFHLVEHVFPMGFSRPTEGARLPQWSVQVLTFAATNYVLPTYAAVGVALVGVFRPGAWAPKVAGLAFAAVGFLCMTQWSLVHHSCYGEAPHYLWWLKSATAGSPPNKAFEQTRSALCNSMSAALAAQRQR